MFLLNLVALLQVCLLPGIIIYLLFGLGKRSLFEQLLYIFLLSALSNFFIVQVLLLLGLYHQIAIICILSLELIWIRLLATKKKLVQNFGEWRQYFDKNISILPSKLVLHILSITIIIFLFLISIQRFGSTFILDDAIFSWNRWAIEMSNNSWPSRTLGYPQLVPSNYSLFYVISKNQDIWFFPKAWIALFYSLVVLSLYIQLRKIDIRLTFLTCLFTYYLFDSLFDYQFLYGGIVDFVLVAFAINSTLLALAFFDSPRLDSKDLVLSVLFALGCALTKQGGLYILLLMPLLTYLFKKDSKYHGPMPKNWTRSYALALVAGLGSYLFYGFLLSTGPNILEFSKELITTAGSNQAHNTLSGRFMHALGLVGRQMDLSIIVLLLFLLPFSLFRGRIRILTATVAIPYFLIWSLSFSYNLRNLSLALPFIALGISAGVLWILDSFIKLRFPIRVLTILIIISFSIALLSRQYNDRQLLILHNRELSRSLGNFELNRELSSYLRAHKEGMVFTTYRVMQELPYLSTRFYQPWISKHMTIRNFESILADDAIKFLFIHNRNILQSEIQLSIDSMVTNNQLKLEFSMGDDYKLYKKIPDKQK